MPGTRHSDSILKVEPDAQLWGVMYTDCRVKGSLEPHTKEALDGPEDNPFHGLVNSASGNLLRNYQDYLFPLSEVKKKASWKEGDGANFVKSLVYFVPNHKAF